MGVRRGVRRVCVLASGGLDSAVLIAELLSKGREVHPLYVRCGFIWEDAELSNLRRFLKSIRSPRLKPLGVVAYSMKEALPRHWGMTGRGVPPAGAGCASVYIPGRNLVLFTAAAVFCAARGVPAASLAVLKGNPFSDATPAFLRQMSAAGSAALGFTWKVSAPYLGVTKRSVVARAKLLGLSPELTLSCQKPRRGRACGRCSKCEELELAL